MLKEPDHIFQAEKIWQKNMNYLEVLDHSNAKALRQQILDLRGTDFGHMRWSALGNKHHHPNQ